ncbi:universal stress protein [Thiomicrorhabdus sediminis]|uniref:UspA domain-containing protein n=1 Tax=Thiomicrorhabdus sediminis TaxID=2580412 RepID=A0A4P9K7B5_9GAMM|nr:universal stress protein [Thiomicrorhabdus sediminis]QCU90975.1 hypothetical protein FE785_10230 [Thiomicrorhabdus sediminis]
MDTLKTILFVSEKGLQQEQNLFSWTLELAARHNAVLKVLRVLPAVSSSFASWLENSTPESMQKQQQAMQIDDIKSWLQQAEQLKVKTTLDVQFGKLFFKVIEQVLTTDADLVVKLSDDTDSIDNTLFGSQDLHLLRKCPCAVLLHKNGNKLPYKNVVASIDVETDFLSDDYAKSPRPTLDPQRLNSRIMNWATQLYPETNLRVIHAWMPEGEELIYHWNTDWSEEDIYAFNEKERHLHQKAMDLEVEPYYQKDPNLQTVLTKGLPQKVISDWLTQHPCDLLVMGTVARVGIAGWFIGNTAEEILQQVNCSVLAVKPKEFVTPIKL